MYLWFVAGGDYNRSLTLAVLLRWEKERALSARKCVSIIVVYWLYCLIYWCFFRVLLESVRFNAGGGEFLFCGTHGIFGGKEIVFSSVYGIPGN